MSETTHSPIEEARRAGTAYIRSFGGDLQAVCADLRRLAREEERQVVARPPKPPHPWRVRSSGNVRAAG